MPLGKKSLKLVIPKGMNLFLKNTYFYQNFNKYLKKAILTKKVLLFKVQTVKTSLKFFQNNIKDYIGYFFF